jgi:hypothetical protein
MVVAMIWRGIRMRRIAESRIGEGFGTFHSQFLEADVPREITRIVYSKFQDWCSDVATGFPVRAEDNIADIYGIVDEDLDEMVQDTLAECGRELPSAEQLRQMLPVITVRDFVNFIVACPTTASSISTSRARQ